MFHVSVGTAALSAFRLEKLCAALRDAVPGIVIKDTRHCYFSELKDELLSGTETKLLDKVLGIANMGGEPADADKYLRLLVIPRLGTISPWSTKATDIAQHCGLSGVKRIERGVVYYLSAQNGKHLSEAEQAASLPLLHDRMTETVLDSIEGAAEQIFQHGVPQPLTSVDILNGGGKSLEQANFEMGLALSPDEIEYLEIGRAHV
jgi:phosphoribosylformylglycinamidine synthase